MKSWIKHILTRLWYRPGTVHHVLWGPLRGMLFKCSENTGLGTLTSGNERDNQRVYASVVRSGDTVVDAGANWGMHTIYLAKLVGVTGQVHAFEPHPVVVDELRWHVDGNQLTQVTVHAGGLLDAEGSIPFVLGKHSKISHFATANSPASRNSLVTVPCQTLDHFAATSGLNALRLIKIDVEGAEGKVLQGAKQTIARFRPHIVIELHSPKDDLEVARVLTAWDYELRRVDGSKILYLDRSWPDPHGVWGTLHALPR